MTGPLTGVVALVRLPDPLVAPATVLALALAVTVDGLFGEVPGRVHPVALFGRVVSVLDRVWDAPRLVGVGITLVAPLAFAGVFGGFAALATLGHPLAGVVVGGLLLSTTVSLRMLRAVTREVVELTDSNPEQARERVRALVGRDASTLSAGELRSGATESLAENLADGFVAPLVAFLVGGQVSLSVGVGCAAWVKGVNTLDSMLGYTSKPVGWASARLDDVVMWVPARVTALLIAVAARDPRALSRARSWAHDPPSPNSGWPMATLAAVLRVRLVKPDVYTLDGGPNLPTADDAARGIRVVTAAGLLGAVVVGALLWAGSAIQTLGVMAWS